MTDSFNSVRFISLIPKLLSNSDFRNELKDMLDEDAKIILSRTLRGETISGGDMDTIYDSAYDTFCNNTGSVLSLGWDGDFPGMSGAVWISELEGVYIVRPSDYDDEGPFGSLDEALESECFSTTTANPELDSDVIPLAELLKIAEGVVDWENDGEIWINSVKYVVKDDDLVEAESE